MVLIQPDPRMPGDFAKPFDSEECLKIARELCEKGTLMGDGRGTPPGLVSIIDLSHEMHRAYTTLLDVLLEEGWVEVHPGYLAPPDTERLKEYA